MSLIGVTITTALMHWDMDCHKELAQTISLLLAQILGSDGANRNGEKLAAAMPILCLSVKKSCNLQGHQNSEPSKILLDCIESSNMEILTN